MLATGLVFALGALVASLVGLLLVPLVWRKAQRLARREFEATIPASVDEMRAEVDAVRASSAFEIRRGEMRLAQMHETSTLERAEAGRIVVENGELRARQAEMESDLAARAIAIGDLDEKLAAVTAERNELHETRQELRRKLLARAEELDALALKHHALREHADEQRLGLAAAETRILQLSDALRASPPRGRADPAAAAATVPIPTDPSPRPLEQPVAAVAAPPAGAETEAVSGSNRLRAAIASRVGGRRSPSPEQNAEIRERISDLAARVIQKQIETQGPQSPVAQLITEAEAAAVPAAAPTLADRVRRLMADEAPAPAPALAPEPADEAEAAAPLAPVSEAAAPAAAKRSDGGRSRPRSRR